MPDLNVFCTSGQAIVRAGKFCNTDFYSGMATIHLFDPKPVQTFILQAECEICNMARENYVSTYATLSTDKKYILEKMASCLAAIDMIAYNMSEYTSRVEAEDMVNILRDIVLRDLSILRDKKAQDYLNAA